uniref:Uncharacterized protein n=1 Tax=Caenorhabditis japonica TaxID=281687 RepID=A0A8R1DYA7_CAEJA
MKPSPPSFHSPTTITSSPTSGEKKECAVCKNPNSSGYHFGCIACAACSAFFRRTVVLARKYYCRRDPVGNSLCPLDRRHRSNCRACRYVRCVEMGMNPSSVQNLRDSIKPRSPGETRAEKVLEEEEERKEKMEDHMFSAATPGSWISSTSGSNETLPAVPKDIPSENYIEILVELYQRSVERRRMFYSNGSLREILGGSGLRMRPTRFDERYYKERMRFELIVYIEMWNSMKVFREFDLDTKETLIRGCAVAIAMLEKYYISVKYNGIANQQLIAPDGSYIDLSDHGAQFNDHGFTDKLMDKDTCLTLLYDPLRVVLNEIGPALEHSRMTDTELCALFAILLFNTASDNLSDASRNAVMMARNRVMKDWFEFYAKQGKEPEEAGLRVGNTLLLLTAVRNALAVHRENFHVIRVFNVMEYDKLIDDLDFF